MDSVENFGCWENGCNSNIPQAQLQSAWLHLCYAQKTQFIGWLLSRGVKTSVRESAHPCPILPHIYTQDSWCQPPVGHPFTIKVFPQHPTVWTVCGSAGVCPCPSVCCRMLDCMCASLRAWVRAWKEVVCVAGVAARSWKVLKVGVLLMVGGWLLFGWV